jgi:hypothetical protein
MKTAKHWLSACPKLDLHGITVPHPTEEWIREIQADATGQAHHPKVTILTFSPDSPANKPKTQ